MAKIYTLKDREGATLYPVTSSKAVINGNGEDLDAMLASERRQQAKALRGYATSEALAGGLAGKQDALTPSSDLQITDNIIGLTDMAKKRLFIDMWNEACGEYGRYNEQTGFFELNGLVDISYEEAIAIYYETFLRPYPRGTWTDCSSRTFLPMMMWYGQSANSAFVRCKKLEILGPTAASYIAPTDIGYMFSNCVSLRRVEAAVYLSNTVKGTDSCFTNCENLEFVNFGYVRCDLNLRWSPKLTLEMMGKIVTTNNGIPTKGVTFTVHPDVYSKITDPDNAEWHPLLVQAEAKSISFATI